MKFRQTPSRDEQQAFLDYGDRAVDGDTTPPTTDLESTYLRVQRSMRADRAVHGTMPDHLKARAWEDIVQNSTAAPTGRFTGDNRPRPIPWLPLPQIGWTGVANVALALLIVIAGFGAWRVFDGGIGGRSGSENDPAPSQPHYAQAPMTPVPIATADASASVAPITACDFSQDIPILTSVEYSAYKGTALYLWKDQAFDQHSTGDLVLRCAGEEDTVLASDVYNAWPGPREGVVSFRQYPDPARAPVYSVATHLDLVTGRSVSFGSATQSMTLANGGTDFVRSEWVFGVSVDDPSVLQVANLRTMESREISEFTDAIPSDRSAPWSVTSDDTIVIGFRYPYSVETSDSGAVITGPAMPGDMLVINGDFRNTHWITIPEGVESIREAWLSPNGDYLAVATYSGSSTMDEQRAYAVISTEDGRLISRSEPAPTHLNASVSWVQDGTAIVFAERHSVMMLPADEGAAATTLVEVEGELFAPRSTYNASTVVVQEVPVQDDAGNDDAGEYAAHIVDTLSGEVTPVAGRDVNDMLSWIPVTNTLAMVMPDRSDPETTTLSFYDAATGEHIEDVDGIPYPYSTNPSARLVIGKSSIATTPDATSTLVTLGSQHMFLTSVVDGEAQVREVPQLPEPYGGHNGMVTADIADDGSMVSVIRDNDEARTRFVLDLTDPDATWLEVPTEQGSPFLPFVSFVIAP